MSKFQVRVYDITTDAQVLCDTIDIRQLQGLALDLSDAEIGQLVSGAIAERIAEKGDS